MTDKEIKGVNLIRSNIAEKLKRVEEAGTIPVNSQDFSTTFNELKNSSPFYTCNLLNGRYQIGVLDKNTNVHETKADIQFQYGPVEDGQWNGITNEVLIDLLIHRIEDLNQGEFKSDYNDIALQSLKAAKYALEERMRKRNILND